EELAAELKNIPGAQFIVGDGAKLCYTYMSEQGIPCRVAPSRLVMQSAIGVGIVGERMALAGQTVSAQDLSPVYLRLSQAERERNERIGAAQHE
ncbi:tRNA (adenosine(37)-N6)-threonylcarbamoyltransferase complex dimerization subunit type 1 TsaB, partial [bacterium]|nr:tRNA (adenosine(37)-N6)-threonylcarbamoyltransferase complex dimerization subunit type 1 TsaB [bacterium]